MGAITLEPTKSAAASAFLFVTVLLFTVTYYCFSRPFVESYWADIRGEQFRKDFGFATGLIRIPGHQDADSAPLRIFGITHVAPGGSFARAGVRAGDLPVALAISGYGRACPKHWGWIRDLCEQYLGGPCLITGLAAADRQEQVGAMFYATLSEARQVGQYRVAIVPASALGANDWRKRVRSVNVSLTKGPA